MSNLSVSKIVDLSVEFKAAIKNGDIDKIQELAQKGAPTDVEIGGVPALLYAAQRDMWNVVDELFVLEVDLDVKYDVLGWALIHQMASAGKNEELHNYLPYINFKNVKEIGKGQTPLMIAIEAGHKETFKILLEHGGELRATDNEQNNVAHYLAKVGWNDELELISEKQHKLFIQPNKKSETVLSITGLTLGDFMLNTKNVVETVESVDGVKDTLISTDSLDVKENAVDVEEAVSPAKKKLSKVKRI